MTSNTTVKTKMKKKSKNEIQKTDNIWVHAIKCNSILLIGYFKKGKTNQKKFLWIENSKNMYKKKLESLPYLAKKI